MRTIDDIHRLIIKATKDELAQKEFKNGERRIVIGLISRMFEYDDEKQTEIGLSQLAADFNEHGLYLGIGEDENTLWAVEYEV